MTLDHAANENDAEKLPALELSDYDYELPGSRIAQHPAQRRDQARMLVSRRAPAGGQAPPFEHAQVRDLPGLLRAGDLLVMNATRVRPARLYGQRPSGGAAEALLLEPVETSSDSLRKTSSGFEGSRFRALVKISGRLREGIEIEFAPTVRARIESVEDRGEVVLAFAPGDSPYSVGTPPLPPYIRRKGAQLGDGPEDHERYQTIYARVPGAVAAPTAGLHFTEALFEALSQSGVGRAEVILHVGAGTFRPLDEHALASGRLHTEQFELPQATADAIAETRERGGRVVAVGTTSVRVLETCAEGRRVQARAGTTDIFLRPGSRFQVVDALLTNFHLPRSSLLLLVAAFAGRERVLEAYREAIENEYRFYSYGDAMLIL